ncbi:hypothetical protein BGZ80_000854 [Entomortierella chlamydospora]|uniref:Uncharacterized protein n=1 Tax=Entomortierella chlamydospora TaxID=101097 RepID=A0A9P6MSG9_9FUNG|nr:hypothetical protein BGZ79_008639 [Entomortierella chlamydospora]KAG0011198.1 hypothetical protein BGZ80_000854 [Entomortierella chlamydospora]
MSSLGSIDKMNEEELEKLREGMREILLGLDINNISDSEDDLGEEGEVVEEEEEEEDIYDDDEWDEPLVNMSNIGDQDDNSEELYSEDICNEEPYNGEVQVNEEPHDEEEQANGDDSGIGTSEVPSEDQQDQLSDGVSVQTPDDKPPVTEAKKKKKKKKNKKKRGYPDADDDEADINGLVPPIADNPYDLSTSEDSRFRLAMDNFRSERYFNSYSNQILETYFTYGGMGTHSNVETDTNADGSLIDFEVDFVYLVSSFLSSHIFEASIWYDEKYFQLSPKVLAAFLKYIRDRKVIPEHQDSIDGAIEITEIAKEEVPNCRTFNSMMPDDIATTCSVLFLPEYLDYQLPENSVSLMEQILKVRSPAEVEVTRKEFQYARVLRITVIEGPNGSAGIAKLELVDMREDEGTTLGGGLFPEGRGRGIYVSSEAAEKLKIGTVIWGTFYMLSNEVIFARPLVALPSFYVEQDEEEDEEEDND